MVKLKMDHSLKLNHLNQRKKTCPVFSIFFVPAKKNYDLFNFLGIKFTFMIAVSVKLGCNYEWGVTTVGYSHYGQTP